MRPTFLIAEPEPNDGLSVRKLIIETAKFNVITAHSPLEALEIFADFPKVNAVIVHAQMVNVPNGSVTETIRKAKPDTFIIVLRPSETFFDPKADYHVSSYEPETLVEFLRAKFGDPRSR